MFWSAYLGDIYLQVLGSSPLYLKHTLKHLCLKMHLLSHYFLKYLC